MPGSAIRYPKDVFGYTGQADVSGDAVTYAVANTAISAGQVVVIDAVNFRQVNKATAAVAQAAIIGVAAEDAAATEVVAIVTLGFTVGKSNTVITAGDRLGADGTTAGNVATLAAASAAGNYVGFACESVTAGATSVRVYVKPF